ncbi:MAG: hypothetical protein ACPGSC_11055 [Granulosicoccaceae bacterium]
MSFSPSREACFLVLHRLYLLSDRQADAAVEFFQDSTERSLSADGFQAAISWLRSQQLLRLKQGLGVMCLTPLGLATVQRALASPDISSGVFPALSGFYGIGDASPIGLCHSTLQVWLDQLGECAVALGADKPAEHCLDATLDELEERVMRSGIDSQTLRFSLQELRSGL